jgi:large subunit ribosomal protein L5
MFIKEKYNKIVVPEMRKKFGYKNNFAVPKIEKVIISTGIGSLKDEVKKEAIEISLSKIAGQKPRSNPAKKSIASFKLRQGATIGYSVTLRNKRMYDFLQKLINIALPRIRDFRGLNSKSIDEAGNFSIGFKEHIAFPEVSNEDIRSAFGLNVTIVTSAKRKEEAIELLRLIGIPFKI